MKTNLTHIFVLSLLLISTTSYGQILLNEKFNTAAMPAGWTTSAIQAAKTWSFVNNPAITSTTGGYYAQFLDNQPTTLNEAALITPSLNCSGRTSVKLQFEHFWDDVEQIHGYVEVSNDGGTVWTIVYSDISEGIGDIGSYAVPMVTTVDLTPYAANQSNVKVRFRFANETSNAGKSWNIDDVVMYSDPDVSMIAYVTPAFPNCTAPLSNAELVTIKFINYSIFEVSNIPYKIEYVTGAANGIDHILSGTYAPALQPYDTATITFPLDLLDMSADDQYGFLCYTDLPGDAYRANDTLYTSRRQWVTHYDHVENFNLTAEGWHPLGGNAGNYWKWDNVPYLGGNQGNGKSWYLQKDGSSAKIDIWLESPVFDLSSLTNPIVSFDIKYGLDYDNCDRAVYFQYTIDNGVTWVTLGTNTEPQWYDSGSNTCWPNTWAAKTKSNYYNVQHHLCNLFGENCVKFRFYADNVMYNDKFSFDNFTIFDNIDLSVTNFLQPIDVGCTFSTTQPVRVRVYNATCNPISNIPVQCDITGAITQSLIGTVPGPVASGGTADYTFPTTFDMTTLGIYTFTSYTDMPTEDNRSNDTLVRALDANNLRIITYPYFEDFEADDGNWQASGGDAGNYWKLDVLPYVNGAEGNGTSWYLEKDGSSTKLDMFLVSPVFDFRENTKPILSFDIKYSLTYDNCDRAVHVQSSIDGGTTWQTVGSPGADWYNSGSNSCWPNTWASGTVNTWTKKKTDLCYLSGESCVKLRIVADNVMYNDVFAIDNIRIDAGTGDDIQPLEIYPTHSGTCTGFLDAEPIGLLIQNNTCRPLTNIPVQFDLTGAGTETILDTIPGPVYRFNRYYHILKKVETNDFGTALDFDGTNDRVAIPALPALGTDYTIEYWLKHNGADGNYDRITSINGNLFETSIRTDGSIYFYDGTWRDTGYNLPNGTWVHMAYVADGSVIKVYLNGTLIYSIASSRNITSQVWSIGGSAANTEFSFITLDELRIWDIARTDKEVKDDMFNTLTGAEPGLIAYYDMEDGTGSSVLTDVTGHGYNGTLTTMDPATDWVSIGQITKTVPATVDMTANGTYDLQVVTGDNNNKGTGLYWSAINDTSVANNTYSQNRYNYIINTFPHTTDFDLSNDGWASRPLDILRKYWHHDNLPYLGGSQGNGKSWYISSDGSSNQDDLWVESPVYDITGLVNPMVSFDIKYSLTYDNCDRAVYFQYSLDGGSNWITLGTNSDPEWYNSGSNTCWPNTWSSGTVSSWQHRQHSLCDILNASCLKFRFYADDVMYSDQFSFDNFDVRDVVDATITHYLDPVDDGCLFGVQQAVTVRVYNYACNQITNVPITCDIAGPNPTTLNGIVPGPIAAGSSVNYTFPSTFNMIATGTYDFTSYIDIPDWRRENDTLRTSVNVTQKKVATYPYFEDFNADNGLWIAGSGDAGNYWDWATIPYLNGDEGYGNSWYLQKDGSATQLDMWLQSPVFDFTQNTNPVISFYIKYDLTYDNCDRAVYLQYSTDGGTAWTTLGTNADTSWYESGSNTCWPNTWASGVKNTWTRVAHDLCELSGEPCVKLRLYADDVMYSDKFAVDNVTVTDGGGDDVEVLRIYPTHSGTCSGFTDSENIGLLIQNNTCRKMTNIPVEFDLTGANTAIILDTIPGPLNRFGRYYHVLKKKYVQDFGTALEFDGTDDYVDCPITWDPGPFTIEWWHNPGSAVNYNQQILAGNGWGAFVFQSENGGGVYVGTDVTNRMTTANLPDGTVSLNTWQHFAFTYEAGVGKFYKNGVLLATKSGMFDPVAWTSLRISTNSTNGVNGKIDELRLWSVARSNVEIKENMFNTLTGSESNLYAYYDMEDGTGSGILTDRTTNANHGTLTNMDPATDWVSMGTVSKTLNETVDMSSPGDYELKIYTGSNPTATGWNYINDVEHSNDTILEVRYNGKINTFPYTQDFETDNGGWASIPLNILNKYWDYDTITYLNGHEGNGRSWYISSNGSSAQEDVWIESPEFDFSSLVSPMISFDLKYSLTYDNCDRAVYMQYSTDGGTNWTTIGTNTEPDWYESGSNTCWPNTWASGTKNSWTHRQHSLCNLVGVPCVKFRFYADDIMSYDQFAFDNFDIRDMIDVGVTAHLAPLYQGCLHTDKTAVTVTVFNWSCSTQTNIPVVCDVTGTANLQLIDTVRASIPSAGSVNFTFTEKIDMTPVGNYQFKTYTNVTTEVIQTNDSTLSPVVSVLHERIDYSPYVEDFNASSGAGVWIPGGGDAGNYWTWGSVPYLGGSEGEVNSWYLVKDGTATQLDMWVESPVYDFTNLENPVMSFDLKYDLTYDNCDRAVYVQYSTDGGTTWATLGTNTDIDWYNSGANTCWPNTWAANTVGSWKSVRRNLCELKGQSCVMFRFYADDVMYNDQFAFDNFHISDTEIDAQMISVSGCWGSTYDVQASIFNRDDGFCSPYKLGSNIADAGKNGILRNMDNADWVVSDLSANNNVAPGCTAGKSTALAFDGVNDFVFVPEPNELDIYTGTIEAWIKTPNAGAGHRGIIIKQSAYGLFLYDNVLETYDWTGTGRISTGINLADNVWHHVAMTFQDGLINGSKIYIDGLEVLTFTYRISNQNQELALGQGNDATASQNFAGQIDEVRVWNYMRSGTEIANNTCTNMTGSESGLLLLYDMEDATGTITTDLTGGPGVGLGFASTSHASSPATNAFDGITGLSGWGNTNTLPSWLMYDLGAGNETAVQVYRIYCSSSQEGGWNSENYNPKTWTFEGSNDASAWTVLHTVPNGWLTQNTWANFDFVNTTPYRYYRMNISAAESGAYIRITELELYDDVRWIPAPITELDLSYSIDGGPTTTVHLTGLNILGGNTETVAIPDVNLPPGLNTFKIWVSNPNGLTDQIFENDTIIADLSLWPECTDHCSNAVEIKSTITHASQTSNATDDPTEDPAFSCVNPGPDGIEGTPDDLAVTVENTVWYWFTTDCDGGDVDVTFQNIGGTACSNGIQVSIDRLDVLPECDPNNYTNVYCNYPNNTDDFTWNGAALGADEIYYITVDGVANGQCDFEIYVSGSVGFDPSKALAGNYEINTTNVNYPTFQAAFDSLKVYGVKAPVVFKARDTIYYEQLDLSGICGVNKDTTVMFTSICDDCAKPIVMFKAEDYTTPCGNDFGQTMHFDGIDDYLSVSNETNFDFEDLDKFSLVAWIKTSSTKGYQIIFSKMYEGAPYTGYELALSNGQLYTILRNDNSPDYRISVRTVATVNDGKWHHVAMTYNGFYDASDVKLYIDGTLQVMSVDLNTLGNRSILNNYGLAIGHRWNTNTYNFEGEIDEAKVWSKVLSENQVQATMCEPITKSMNGLVAYFDMENAPGSAVATDESGNGNNASLVNMNTTNNWYASDISKEKDFGASIILTETDDRVVMPITWTPTEFTVEWWMYPTTHINYNQSLGNGWDKWHFHTDVNGSIYTGTSAAARFSPTEIPNGTVVLNQWQHYAFTYGSGIGKIYKNGNLLASKAMPAPIAWTDFTISSVNQIDELRIWSTERSISEIRDNLYETLTGSEPGLYAYYDMETGVGSVAFDKTANHFDGIMNFMNDWNTTNISPASKNYVLDFDGVNDLVTLANETNFDFERTDPFTVEAWIKTTGSDLIPISKVYNSSPYKGYEFGINASGQLYSWITSQWATDNINEVYTTVVNDGNWHHIAMTYDGSSTAAGTRVYLDGIEESVSSLVYDNLTGTILNNNPINLGKRANLTTRLYIGEMDEVRIWNTERTPLEISTNMSANLTGTEPGLVAYYNMESGIGTTLLDQTSNANNGTLTNMDTQLDWTTANSLRTNVNVLPTTTHVDNYTMKLNGAKYYIFDRIDFTALDTTNARVIELQNDHNITFNDCVFTGDTTQTDDETARTLIYTSGTQKLDSITFSNNKFVGGSYALEIENTLTRINDNQIYNNIFENQSKGAIRLYNHNKPIIFENSFKSNSSRNDFVGISLTDITGSLRIENNLLLDSLSDGTAILLDNATSTGGSEGLITNNMIRFGTADADASYGITLQNASSYQKVYHNSINLTSNAGSALNINGLDFGDIRNNIFNSNANSATISGETNFTEGYNAYNPDYALKGAGSILQNPGFISLSDLHTEEALLKAGTPLSISTDIDGEGRNAVTPFMGADEFLGLVSWTGAVNKDWNNTGNWSSGQIPTRGTTIEIPLAVPNFPEINSKSTKLAEVRNITIHNGAHLYIEPVKYLTAYKNFTNNGEFLIKSDANGTGSFIPMTTPGAISGTGTNKMQLYLTQNKWHYVASPITSANGIFSGYYYWWDETIKDRWFHNDFVDWNWDGTGSAPIVPVMGWTTVSTAMEVGEGYAYWFKGANKTVTFNGIFNSGDYEVSLDFTDQGGDAVQDIYDGWNLLANPYPSTINWNSDGITLTNVDNAVYVYSDDGSKAYDNYYYYMKGVSNSPYPLIALNASDDSCHIAPGQSVFVRANATGAKVKITNQARQHRISTFYKSGEKHPNLLKLSAEHSGNSDELAIRFIPESSRGFDGTYDAIKRYSSSAKVPQISSQINAGELAINTIPEITDGLVIPLSLVAGESGKYSIKQLELNFDPNVDIYLIDKYSQKRTKLNDTPEYSFKTDAGEYKDRFYIVFKIGKSLTEENPEESVGFDDLLTENVLIYSVKKSVNIKFENVQGNDNHVIIQDVLGKKVIHQKLLSDKTNLPMDNFAAGNYIVKVITKNKVYEQKVLIE